MVKRYLPIIFIICILAIVLLWIQISDLQDNTALESSLLDKMHRCYSQKGDQNSCYKEVAEDVLKKSNLEEVLAILLKNQTQPEIFQSCHQMAHLLGRVEYNRNKVVGESLTRCSPVCFAGCYHGVLEGYLIETNIYSGIEDDVAVAKEVSKLCGKKENYENNELHNQCLHGLGHALMFLTDGDLPLSLKFCDGFETLSESEWCYSGAFMENSTSSTNPDHPSKFLKADDPMYPCTILEQKYLEMCYALQSFYFAQVSNYDWNKTITLCYKVPQSYQATCFRSIGQNLVGFSSQMEIIKDNCSLISEEELEKACIQGAVLALSSKYSGDFTKVSEFCALVSNSSKETCYNQFMISMRNWSKTPQDIKKICLSIKESEYRDKCSLNQIAI